jgi:hypothetical protein
MYLRFYFYFAFLFAVLLLSAGPKKTSGSARGENEDLILTVTLYTDPADIQNLLGSDLGGHYFVADVKVEPKYGKEISVDRDDFVLRTDRDGERDRPYEGSQIAGKTALVVGKTKAGGNGAAVDSTPTNGGQPVPAGGPVMYPPTGTAVGGGGAGADSETNKAAIKADTGDEPNPLEKTLDDKILPQKKTEKPVSGLLYFPMEKQKLKDLELLYGAKENRITLRFK